MIILSIVFWFTQGWLAYGKTAVMDWSQFNDSVLIEVQRPAGHPTGNTVCTGVILHPNVILSTAHCADQATSMNIIFDVENHPNAKKKEMILAQQMVIHPDYQPKTSFYKNDLAILFLKNPAPIELKMIRKIPTKNPLKAGDRVTRIGVGLRNGFNARNTTDPIYVGVPSRGVMENSDLYAFVGDSGGPVYSLQHDLLGIHSTLDDFDGKKTPHTFAVYLPDYREWIEKKVSEHGKK